MPGGISPKRKGTRFERLIVNILQEHMVVAKRVPLSGSTEFQKGDIVAKLANGEDFVIEAKARRDEFGLIYELMDTVKSNWLLISTADKPHPNIRSKKEREELLKKGKQSPDVDLLIGPFDDFVQNMTVVFDGYLEWIVVNGMTGFHRLARKLYGWKGSANAIVFKDDRRMPLIAMPKDELFRVMELGFMLAVDGEGEEELEV